MGCLCASERSDVFGKMSHEGVESFVVPIPWTKLTLLQLLLLSNGLVCSELQQSWLYLKLSPSTDQRGKIAWYCCGILLLPLVLKTQKTQNWE